MIYSEAAYFDGAPVKHCADWLDHKRLQRLERDAERIARARHARRQDSPCRGA